MDTPSPESSSGLTEFVKAYGTLCLAIYAIVQVWLIALYKRFLQKPELTHIRAGKLELGYSEYGPTLAVCGTLIVKNKAAIITSMSVQIKRTRDSMTHKFSWVAFRNPELLLVGQGDGKIEMAYAFVVQNEVPKRYAIFFSDYQTGEVLRPHIEDLKNEWQEYAMSAAEQDSANDIAAELAGEPKEKIIKRHYEKFSENSKAKLKVWEVGNKQCYWEHGEYEGELSIFGLNKKLLHLENFRFSVSERDYQTLRLNTLAIQENCCTGDARFNFVLCDYLDPR